MISIGTVHIVTASRKVDSDSDDDLYVIEEYIDTRERVTVPI